VAWCGLCHTRRENGSETRLGEQCGWGRWKCREYCEYWERWEYWGQMGCAPLALPRNTALPAFPVTPSIPSRIIKLLFVGDAQHNWAAVLTRRVAGWRQWRV
jgi:hypothetical protein